MSIDELKKQAAIQAVAQISSGMIVGLGTGSTAFHAVNEIGRRMKEEGLSIIGVPTSSRTADQARGLGIPLATLEEQPSLDLAIDGADEIEISTLNLIKGAGGALLQEKLVEVSAGRFIVIADESKKVDKLGGKFAIPVEVVQFGWKSTVGRLEALGCEPVRRLTDSGDPYITDEKHFLIDCRFGLIDDAAALGDKIKGITGVIEHGLFIGMASQCIIATATGIEVLGE